MQVGFQKSRHNNSTKRLTTQAAAAFAVQSMLDLRHAVRRSTHFFVLCTADRFPVMSSSLGLLSSHGPASELAQKAECEAHSCYKSHSIITHTCFLHDRIKPKHQESRRPFCYLNHHSHQSCNSNRPSKTCDRTGWIYHIYRTK